MNLSDVLPFCCPSGVDDQPLIPKSASTSWFDGHNPRGAAISAIAAPIFAAVATISSLALEGHDLFGGAIPPEGLYILAIVGLLAIPLCGLKFYWARRKKETLTFKEYVEKKCPKIPFKSAEAFADIGKEVITDIYNVENGGDIQDRAARVCKLLPSSKFISKAEKILQKKALTLPQEDIDTLKQVLLIPVSWFFMKQAFASGQGFEKGMIRFKEYGDFNPIVKFFASAMDERQSSHFTKTRKGTPRGRDIPEGLLPFIFKHVHMGTLIDGSSFLKLERFGLSGFTQTCLHGLDLIRTYCAELLGEYDGPNERKEKRTPEEVDEAFSKIYRENGGQSSSKPSTISEMIKWIEKNAKNELKAFTQLLDKHFPKENRDWRWGQEVLLDMTRLIVLY